MISHSRSPARSSSSVACNAATTVSFSATGIRAAVVITGVASSSLIVSVTSDGPVTPVLLVAVPITITVLLGASTSLLLAVIVTVSVLVA